jgi:pimeloyl-ACP methyl ester carboxylesterase
VAALAALGHRAECVALPSVGADVARLGGLLDDARAVEQAATAISGPVIVVAHSYGGAVITQARHPANVERLVYLGAFMPDAGESLVSYLPPGELPPYVNMGPAYSTMAFAQVPALLYGDCDPADVAASMARLLPQSSAAPATPVGEPAWRRLAATYIVLARDQAVPAPLQRMFAGRAAETLELDASHNFFATRGELLARTLEGIAAGARAEA